MFSGHCGVLELVNESVFVLLALSSNPKVSVKKIMQQTIVEKHRELTR